MSLKQNVILVYLLQQNLEWLLNMGNVSLDKGSSFAVAKVSDVIRVRRRMRSREYW